MRAVFRRRSIGSRLSWLFALLSFAGLGAVSLSIYAAMALTLRHEATADLERRASVLLHVLGEAAPPADLDLLRHKLSDFAGSQRDMEVAVVFADGQALYRSGPLGADRATWMEARYPAPSLQPAAWLQVRLDTSTNERMLHRLAVSLLVACVVGTLLVAISGFWVVRAGLAPLRSLARELRSVSADRLGTRLAAPSGADELAPWIEQFNALMQRLEAAYRRLEGFNADVAHELRTPLATLISRCELDMASGRSADELRDSAGANLEELQRLATIVKDMLFLSRADRGARARLGTPSSLADEARHVADFHEAALEEAGLRLAIVGDATVRFDAGLVRRAMSNLLSNAVRYAEAGSLVTVRIERMAEGAQVEVENSGAGLPEPDPLRVFDRFFRADAARGHGSEHHGLGLAIVAAIARMHDGSVIARSSSGTTAVGFTLNYRTEHGYGRPRRKVRPAAPPSAES